MRDDEDKYSETSVVHYRRLSDDEDKYSDHYYPIRTKLRFLIYVQARRFHESLRGLQRTLRVRETLESVGSRRDPVSQDALLLAIAVLLIVKNAWPLVASNRHMSMLVSAEIQLIFSAWGNMMEHYNHTRKVLSTLFTQQRCAQFTHP